MKEPPGYFFSPRRQKIDGVSLCTSPGQRRVIPWLLGMCMSITLAAIPVWAAILYVWTNSPHPSPPYDDWSNAAHTIQEAVDLACVGDTVLVTDGVYSIGGRVTPGSALTNRLVVTNAITVSSVNGPEVTIIQGAGPLGDAAVRCAYLANGALLVGFTLTNGHTRTSGAADLEEAGGGVYAVGARLSNCVISGNAAVRGGGNRGGTLDNCMIRGNSASQDGGGSYGGTLNNCTLSENSAFHYGGGCYYGTLSNCLLSSNWAQAGGGGCIGSVLNSCTLTCNSVEWYGGGGSHGGTLINCTISGNSAHYGGGSSEGTLNYCMIYSNWAEYGGGSYRGTLDSCVLCGNSAKDGGASYRDTLNNCTLARNFATNNGGGSFESTQNNCIVYYNTAGESGDNWHSGLMRYCCTAPDPGGTGSITNAPVFAGTNDYHLAAGSPCIDAGNNDYMPSEKDLDGIPRPLDGDGNGINTVDMGCYEYVSDTSDSDNDGLSDRNEVYGTGTSPVKSDTDGDGCTDYQEMIADTDGTDSRSYFHLVGVKWTHSCVVTFVCTNTRVYSLEFCTNPLAGALWVPVAALTNIPGADSGIMSLTDMVDAVQRTYRVRAMRP